MDKLITYLGQRARVACDEKCNKAWGHNNRPRTRLSPTDDDDYAYYSDDELGDAPENPGTYEGGHAKPISKDEVGNKWCVRECERCYISSPGEWVKNPVLYDWSKRRYNIPDHDPTQR